MSPESWNIGAVEKRDSLGARDCGKDKHGDVRKVSRSSFSLFSSVNCLVNHCEYLFKSCQIKSRFWERVAALPSRTRSGSSCWMGRDEDDDQSRVIIDHPGSFSTSTRDSMKLVTFSICTHLIFSEGESVGTTSDLGKKKGGLALSRSGGSDWSESLAAVSCQTLILPVDQTASSSIRGVTFC